MNLSFLTPTRPVMALVLTLMINLAGCGGGSDSTTTSVVVEPAASTSPELAVSAIIRAIGRQDGQTLDANTLTDQLGLLALVEGASTAASVPSAVRLASNG